MDTPQIVDWDEVLKSWQYAVRTGAVQELSDEQYARLISQRDAEYTRQTLQRMADTFTQFKAEQQPRLPNRRQRDEYYPCFMGDNI